MQELYLQLL